MGPVSEIRTILSGVGDTVVDFLFFPGLIEAALAELVSEATSEKGAGTIL